MRDELWEALPPFGAPLTHLGIIAAKTPKTFSAWTPFTLSQALRPGLVINLCASPRAAYNPRQLGCPYLHIRVHGGGAMPWGAKVLEFLHACDAFFLNPYRAGPLVVHCTHGLNRTGYMLVQLMMRRLGMPAQHAIQVFALARPPGILRQNYTQALLNESGEGPGSPGSPGSDPENPETLQNPENPETLQNPENPETLGGQVLGRTRGAACASARSPPPRPA
jgi:hypothetical protein